MLQKKVFILLFIITSSFSFGQGVIICNDFENSWNSWTNAVVTNPAGAVPCVSNVASSSDPTISTAASNSYYVSFNSYTCETDDQVRLKSPVFSTTGITGITVNFSWSEDKNGSYTNTGEAALVQWSTDGSTWTSATSYPRYVASAASSANGTWVSKSCSLPVGAENQATLYVCFLFTSKYGNNCNLDNVSVQGTGASAAMTGTYTIGPTGTYASITSARAAIECKGVSGPVIFELQTTYTDASETYPITFSPVSGASAVNTITYRPVAGATGLVCDGDPGSSNTMIVFSGADYITLNGSAGGTGTVIGDIQWTIRNTRTAATPGQVISLISDAIYNSIKFLTIEGEALSYPLIKLGTAAAGGNDNNTISYCKIQDLTTGGTAAFPSYGVRSLGTVGQENSSNTIDNCHFIDVYYSSVGGGGNVHMSAGSDGNTITNNHFYHNSGTTLAALDYYFHFIAIFAGGGYTITGNYMGGRASSCGGSAFTVSGTSYLWGIYTNSACTGSTITISNNTMQNISITSTYAGDCFDAMVLYGSTNFTIGSVGAGNTIGSMSATGSIAITNNTVSGSMGSFIIYCAASGTNSIAYNNIGGITIAGTRTGTYYEMIFVTSASGATTVDNNTVGGAIANSIDMTIASELIGFYCTNTTAVTVTNNTFQYFRNRSSYTTEIIWNADGVLTCTGNTIKNITTDGNNDLICILHGSSSYTTIVEGATISSNTIQDITISSTGNTANFYGIEILSSGSVTCSSNTIGSTSANNISLAPQAWCYGIYFNGNGTYVCNSNTIQQWNMTHTGTSVGIEGISNWDGIFTTCNSNTIKDLTLAGNAAQTLIDFEGTADAATISSNVIQSITLSNTGTSARLYAIYIYTSAGVTSSSNTIGSTTVNNISIAGQSYSYGMYFTGNGTFICNSNTIQQWNLTNTAVTSGFSGINCSDGTFTTCNSNTIKDLTLAGAAWSSMIDLEGSNDAATVSSNTLQSITMSSTSASARFYGIYFTTSATVVCSSNTIGSTTNNNITIAGNGASYGIEKEGTGAFTFDNNIIQEFNFTGTGNANFAAIYYGNGLATSISGNKIKEIDMASTAGAGYYVITAIYQNSSTAGTHLIENNEIKNLNITTTASVQNYVQGIYLNAGTGILKRNRVRGLTNQTTNTGAMILGVNFPSGTWNFHNNVVLINNGGYTNDITIYGLYDFSTGSSNYYHNTVKIYGTVASAGNSTECFFRGSTATGTDVVKNNIFQNIRTRTAGTAGMYTEYYDLTTTLTTDKNYLEVSADANKLAYYNASGDLAFEAFKAASGATNSLNGTNTLASNGSAAAGFTGANVGVDLFSGGTVIVDKDNVARDASPWMGAFEGVSVLPIQLVSFKGFKDGINNNLIWETASELNNDYFTIEKTDDGDSFEIVGIENGAGTSNQYLTYFLTDYNVRPIINYYRLKQTDFDGQSTLSELIAIDNTTNITSKEIVMKTNILGQEINENYRGLVVIVYSDGSSVKVLQ